MTVINSYDLYNLVKIATAIIVTTKSPKERYLGVFLEMRILNFIWMKWNLPYQNTITSWGSIFFHLQKGHTAMPTINQSFAFVWSDLGTFQYGILLHISVATPLTNRYVLTTNWTFEIGDCIKFYLKGHQNYHTTNFSTAW